MITSADLRIVPLLAELPPEQIDAIAARAADLTLDPGDWLIREGEQAAFFFLLRGRVTVFETMAGVDREINAMGRAPILAKCRCCWGARPSPVSAPTNPAAWPGSRPTTFNELILCSRRLSDQLFATMGPRITQARTLIVELPRDGDHPGGAALGSGLPRAAELFARNRVIYTWVDKGDGDAAAQGARRTFGRCHPARCWCFPTAPGSPAPRPARWPTASDSAPRCHSPGRRSLRRRDRRRRTRRARGGGLWRLRGLFKTEQ